MAVFCSGLIAFLATVAILFVLAPVARRLGLVDNPEGRKRHQSSVPVVGGIAIYLGFVSSMAALTPVFEALPWLMAGGLLVVGVGALDDYRPISAGWRFAAQTGAALLAIYGADVRLYDLGNLSLSGGVLTLTTGCPGLILYGRRRMGKSTLLSNLNGFLPPEVRVVQVSMHKPDAFTSLGYFLDLVTQKLLASWAGGDRPKAGTADLPSFFTFLDHCNQALEREGQRLLLALDEYEYIDRKIGKEVFSEDLLAMLRESIQTHRRLIWVFAGSHHIAELTHAPWSSYLVSVRTVEVPPFTEAETRLLLTNPLKYSSLWASDDPKRPRFDPAFWGDGGIERIHTETGGWPALVQLVAETTVDLLKDFEDAQRVNATLLERALCKAVSFGDVVLRQLMQPEDALPEEWEYLRVFRTLDDQPPPDNETVYQALRRRLLVTEENGRWRLCVPLMQRWLREHG